MKKRRFVEVQIIAILCHAEGGVPSLDLCREPPPAQKLRWQTEAKPSG